MFHLGRVIPARQAADWGKPRAQLLQLPVKWKVMKLRYAPIVMRITYAADVRVSSADAAAFDLMLRSWR
jgi:hypothetical protein